MTKDELLARLTDSLAEVADLESLTRPLLELLEIVTGFESTYLTFIQQDQGTQTIRFARNVGRMTIPEAFVVPWEDTLCRRALEEGRLFTDDVAGCWGDSEAARAIGLQSYASAPVRVEGEIWGTLCAASDRKLRLSREAPDILQLFARLIGQQIERELLIERLKQANAELEAHATSDPLTGVSNRRALMTELKRMLARGAREGSSVMVAMIDLDRFKEINDGHGHEVGDAFLVEIARRLQAVLRNTDLLARVGGDEFVAVGPGPRPGEDEASAVRAWWERLAAATVGRFDIQPVAGGPARSASPGGGHAAMEPFLSDLPSGDDIQPTRNAAEAASQSCAVDYAGASVGVVAIAAGQADGDQALRLADRAMYVEKKGRRDSRR